MGSVSFSWKFLPSLWWDVLPQKRLIQSAETHCSPSGDIHLKSVFPLTLKCFLFHVHKKGKLKHELPKRMDTYLYLLISTAKILGTKSDWMQKTLAGPYDVEITALWGPPPPIIRRTPCFSLFFLL